MGTRLGFIEAPWPSWDGPCMSRNEEKEAELPAWVTRLIQAWAPEKEKESDTRSDDEAISSNSANARPLARRFGNAASGLTAAAVKLQSNEEITQNILMAGAIARQTQQLVREAVKETYIPITFAGGRIAACGSVAGHAMAVSESGVLNVADKSSVCLIVLDLFANMDPDILDYTQYSTRWPAAYLLNEPFPNIPRKFPGFGWIRPWLSYRRVAVIGLQKPSESEIAFLENNKIFYTTCDDLASRGAADTVASALSHINPLRDLPVHLSVNAFALDYVVEQRLWPEGRRKILAQEVVEMVEGVVRTGMLGGLDILEVEQLPPDDYESACSLFNEILGCITHQVLVPLSPIPLGLSERKGTDPSTFKDM